MIRSRVIRIETGATKCCRLPAYLALIPPPKDAQRQGDFFVEAA